MHLRVNVEVKGVALLAPGRTRLEFGAVGHFDVDRVIFGVNAGLHVNFPWVSCWFPTSGRRSERAPLLAGSESCNRGGQAGFGSCASRSRGTASTRSAKPPNSSAVYTRSPATVFWKNGMAAM